MSLTNETAQRYVSSFISRHKETLASPAKLSHQIEMLHLKQELIERGIATEDYVYKSFTLDDFKKAGEIRAVQFMEEKGEASKSLPIPRLSFTSDGMKSFLSLLDNEPKFIDFADYLANSSLLSQERQLDLYRYIYNNTLNRKRGPKKKVYARSWNIYFMIRVLVDNYGMAAYSSESSPNPDTYAVDLILDNLFDNGIMNITRNDLINDYRKFKRIKFLIE